MTNTPVSPICILYVSGSPDNERPLRHALEKGELTANIQRVDNEAALIAALAQNPDLIVFKESSSHLNEMRLLDMVKRLNPQIPFIRIPEILDESSIVQVFEPDTDHFLLETELSRLSSIVQNILDQKQFRKNEAVYQDVFENTPVATLVEDFSQVKRELDTLRESGVTDFSQYIHEHPEFVEKVLRQVRILDANNVTLSLYNARQKTDVLGTLERLISSPDFKEELIAFAEGKLNFERELAIETIPGKTVGLLVTVTYYSTAHGQHKALVHLIDITGRKKAEEEIRDQNEFLALLNEMTQVILLSTDYVSTMQSIAFKMKRIINADDSYILRWNEETQQTIPVTTTAALNFEFSEVQASPDQIGITSSVLHIGHTVTIEDVYNSPEISPEITKHFPAKSIIAIPLIAGDQKLGVAIIAFNSHHSFSQDEIDRAEQAGNQVALALWNFQQSAQIQQKLKENDTLAKIERALSESERVGTDEVLQLIVDSARELMPHAERSVIHLLDPDEQTLFARAVSGYDDRDKEYRGVRMRLGEGIAGQVMSEGITINIGDINTHPKFLLSPSTSSFRSLLVAPVLSGSNHIGTISVQSNQPQAFTKNDAELLKSLAIQAAVALENTRLFEATQQRLKEVNILYQVSRALALSLDADQLIRDVIGLLQQIFNYYYVQIYLIDPITQNLVIKHGSGPIGAELVQQGHYLRAGEGIVGHVAETGAPFVTNNVDEIVFFKRNPLLQEAQYEIAVPIKIDYQVIGVLDIQQIPPHRFSDNDLQLMTAIADQLAVVLQKANLYSTLQTALQQEQMVRSQLIQSERLALVGRLLASVSHELNNPLQAIQNALFLLKEEKNISTQAQQDLDVILSEAERMAALIERLRSAYRPVRMQDFQAVDINNLIEDVHTLISTHMRHKMIVFEFIPDADLPDVSGLPDQLRQVVLNLFLNAIEIMKPGGRLTVLTRCLPNNQEVILTVKDTGPGIDAEIMPHIFDAFITSKHTGTGLGLTITHDIIQQHHGRISAENDPEGGAVFNVWLPIDEGGDP
jgi:signal transduction histidine kinase/PAS domain-containing protein